MISNKLKCIITKNNTCLTKNPINEVKTHMSSRICKTPIGTFILRHDLIQHMSSWNDNIECESGSEKQIKLRL
ncbi:hypothetical protein C0J52_17238 [Blattella germanica]|nr:hypothetical protein C0J52_17238 [Blattella germanica]